MKSVVRWPLPFMVLLVAPGCGAAPSKDRSTMAARSTDRAAVLNRIGLTLPPSANVEYADYMAGMDDAARVRSLMSEADWTAFLDQIVRKAPRPPEFLEDANPLLGPPEGTWHPTAVAGLKTGQVAWGVNASEGLNIGFAPADRGKVRVFLFWHQT